MSSRFPPLVTDSLTALRDHRGQSELISCLASHSLERLVWELPQAPQGVLWEETRESWPEGPGPSPRESQGGRASQPSAARSTSRRAGNMRASAKPRGCNLSKLEYLTLSSVAGLTCGMERNRP